MTVKAMSMEVVCEKSKHQIAPGSPNVCLTPAAPSPLPMPYPIKSDSGTLTVKCDRIRIEKKGVHSSFCKASKAIGNEPGCAATKDITVPGINKGVPWCLPIPAVTIHFEGMPVNISANMGFGDSR
jgi:hypothetical protein